MAEAQPSEHADETFTIDEFAARTGFTSRNIRALQTEGLLHGPEIRGRTGYYDGTHLRRLKLISRLQSEGFSRPSIATLIEARDRGTGLSGILGVGDALPEVLLPDQHIRTSLAHFRKRMGDQDWAIAEAVGMRLAIVDGDEVEILNPALFEIGREFAQAGFSLRSILQQARRLREAADSIAERYIDELREHWRDEDPADPSEVEQRVAMLKRLSPLVAKSVDAALRQSMNDRLREVVDELDPDQSP